MTRGPRLLRLIQRLDARYGRTRAELARELGVSERTLYRDLAGLGEMGIPLAESEGRYRLADGSSWRPLVLTAFERATLRLLLGTPALRKNAALARRLETLAARLAASIDGGTEGIVLADLERSGPVAEGIVESIEEAIRRQQTLRIDYVSVSSASRRVRRVDPWALFHRGEAWYLAGRCHESKGPRMFRLDRIRVVSLTGDLFLRPENFDIDAWLRDAWSLWGGGEPRNIVVRFAPEVAPLVEHGKHHEGESIDRLPDGSVEYRVRLGQVVEIARWIVTFGGRAVALDPPELVARVREMGEAISTAHEAGDAKWKSRPVAANTTKQRRTRRD